VSRYRIESALISAWLPALLALCTFGCGLVDLRPVLVETVPTAAFDVLASRDDSLSITFSAEPERLEAERAFIVRSTTGAVEGDFSWNGSGFTWKPVLPWNPGVRYRLILKGSIRTLDGREVRPELDLPFFVLRSTEQPCVVSFLPVQGTSIAAPADPVTVLSLEFSEAMDTRATEAAFNFKPATGCDFSWNAGLTSVAITPRDRLSACVMYRWSLGTGARASDGTPLGRTAGGTFITDLDDMPPRVERVYPVLRSGDTWVEAATDVSGLDAGHSLAVLFSEPVDPVSATAGIHLEPGQAGRADAIAPRLVVYTPERDWLPGQALTVVVSAEVQDTAGLRTGEEYRLRFTPLVPHLSILSVSSGIDETITDFGSSSILTTALVTVPDGRCTLTLRFSAPFDAASKTATVERITLSAFFPAWLPPPALRDLCWLSDDTLVCTWEGLRVDEADHPNFYRLLVPGGQGGILSDKGLWLKEDCVLYLEVRT